MERTLNLQNSHRIEPDLGKVGEKFEGLEGDILVSAESKPLTSITNITNQQQRTMSSSSSSFVRPAYLGESGIQDTSSVVTRLSKRNKRTKHTKRTHDTDNANDATTQRMRFKKELKDELKEELKGELTEEIAVLVKMEIEEDARTVIDTPIITDEVLGLERERDGLAIELAKEQLRREQNDTLWQEDVNTNIELRYEIKKISDELEKVNKENMEAKRQTQQLREDFNNCWLELQEARRVIASAKEARAQRMAENREATSDQ